MGEPGAWPMLWPNFFWVRLRVFHWPPLHIMVEVLHILQPLSKDCCGVISIVVSGCPEGDPALGVAQPLDAAEEVGQRVRRVAGDDGQEHGGLLRSRLGQGLGLQLRARRRRRLRGQAGPAAARQQQEDEEERTGGARSHDGCRSRAAGRSGAGPAPPKPAFVGSTARHGSARPRQAAGRSGERRRYRAAGARRGAWAGAEGSARAGGSPPPCLRCSGLWPAPSSCRRGKERGRPGCSRESEGEGVRVPRTAPTPATQPLPCAGRALLLRGR